MSFNPLLYPGIWQQPVRLTDVAAWHSHIPFAFAVMQIARPKLFVELGTHKGDSYCSFCQAVVAFNLDTICYAVDTWEGDAQAGYYSDQSVYEDLKAYHDGLYGRFSTLLKSTFDEALQYFSDGSIDLLHIDGCHTYDAVRHDFESWLPKMSPRGVVLLHDTAVRERNFGVWRLWEEVCHRFPSFEFKHGSGLGVLAVGERLPSDLLELIREAHATPQVCSFFAHLGGQVALAEQNAREQVRLRTEQMQLRTEQMRLNSETDTVRSWSEVAKAQLHQINVQLANNDAAIGTIREQIRQAEQRTETRLEIAHAEMAERIDKAERGVTSFRAELDELLALRSEFAGPIELMKLLRDAQHRLGVPFTLSGLSARVRAADRLLKTIGSGVKRAPLAGRRSTWSNGESTAVSADSPDVRVQCDRPAGDGVLRVGGKVCIEGWALASRGVKEVQVFIDDQAIGTIPHGRVRPDVRAAFPDVPGSASSGFREYFDLGSLPTGPHVLCVRVVDNGGYCKDVSRQIEVDHAYTEAHIDVPDINQQYQLWLEHNAPTEGRVKAWEGAASRLSHRPKFSILMPVFNPPLEFLRQAIQSVLAQAYPEWELCIVDDASTNPRIRPLLENFARQDTRIRVLFAESNGGISAASNAALAMADGEFIGLLDHDDELWPNALYECAKLLNSTPDADLIYSDEDKVLPDGLHYDPFFKPDWSPDLLTSMMYICHFGVYRNELVVDVGGFRSEFDGSQDYDLALRVTERTDRVFHIPTVLYSWRAVAGSTAQGDAVKPYTVQASRRALEESVSRRGTHATVLPGVAPGRWRMRLELDGQPPVTIVIPTGGNMRCFPATVQSVLTETSYPGIRVLVVDNSEGDSVRKIVDSLHQHHSNLDRVECRLKPFNFSALINRAVAQVDSSFIVIMNDDVTVLEPTWLEAMLEHAQRPEIGVVGAKLLYPDGAIQHAGVTLGIGGVAGHLFKHYPEGHSGPVSLIDVVRNVSAVTFACAMMRRSLFDELGGLNADHLPIAFNDVEFCLRARARGYRIVYTPHAVLYHHESASRGTMAGVALGEQEYMLEVWGDLIRRDPYYNPNLSLRREDYSLRVLDMNNL